MENLLPKDKIPRAAMQVMQDCLVISVQIDLYDATLEQLRIDFLEQIQVSGVRRAIFDLSTVDLLDPHAYESICDTANMAKLMGTQTVMSGIRPGVASALVELGVDVKKVTATLNLEDGFVRLAEIDKANEPSTEDPDSVGESLEGPDNLSTGNATGSDPENSSETMDGEDGSRSISTGPDSSRTAEP